MLVDAVRDINERLRKAEQERCRRTALKASLRQAEAYGHQVEELLLSGTHRVPPELAAEVREFVRHQCSGYAPGLRDPVWNRAVPLLDLLFEVQEVLQPSSPSPAGAAVTIFEAA